MPTFPYAILDAASTYLEEMHKLYMQEHPDADEEDAWDEVYGDFMDFFMLNVR